MVRKERPEAAELDELDRDLDPELETEDIDGGPNVWETFRKRRIRPDQWKRFQENIAEIFQAFGMDLDTPGTRRTPERFLRALYDSTAGYEGDPKLLTAFPTECRGGPDCHISQIVEGPIPFFSLCEHHSLPFYGMAHVGYIAHEQIIGISKLTRLVRMFARRFGKENVVLEPEVELRKVAHRRDEPAVRHQDGGAVGIRRLNGCCAAADGIWRRESLQQRLIPLHIGWIRYTLLRWLDSDDVCTRNRLQHVELVQQVSKCLAIGIFANRPADVLLVGAASGVKVLQ